MKRAITAAALAAMSLAAYGQSAVHKCQLIADTQQRAACLLEAFPAVAPEPAAPTPPAAAAAAATNEHGPMLYLRNSASVTEFGKLDLGDDGAQFSGTRSGGKTVAAADLGAVVTFPATSVHGWQPFAYGAWTRDESSDPKSDKRTLGLGVQGAINLGEPTGPQRDNLYIYTTANLARRVDVYGPDDATQLGVRFDFLKLNWAHPLPGTVGFVPHAGVVLEHRDGGGGTTTDGRWSSVYVGSKFTYKLPVDGLKGFGFTALARWYGDLSVPDGNDKRRARFG